METSDYTRIIQNKANSKIKKINKVSLLNVRFSILWFLIIAEGKLTQSYLIFVVFTVQ